METIAPPLNNKLVQEPEGNENKTEAQIQTSMKQR
jgi:hypothetical protein